MSSANCKVSSHKSPIRKRKIPSSFSSSYTSSSDLEQFSKSSSSLSSYSRRKNRTKKKKERVLEQSFKKQRYSRQCRREHLSAERFQIVTEQDQLKWNLLSDVTEYVNYIFYFFIPEKDIIDAVWCENLVPTNLKS